MSILHHISVCNIEKDVQGNIYGGYKGNTVQLFEDINLVEKQYLAIAFDDNSPDIIYYCDLRNIPKF